MDQSSLDASIFHTFSTLSAAAHPLTARLSLLFLTCSMTARYLFLSQELSTHNAILSNSHSQLQCLWRIGSFLFLLIFPSVCFIASFLQCDHCIVFYDLFCCTSRKLTYTFDRTEYDGKMAQNMVKLRITSWLWWQCVLNLYDAMLCPIAMTSNMTLLVEDPLYIMLKHKCISSPEASAKANYKTIDLRLNKNNLIIPLLPTCIFAWKFTEWDILDNHCYFVSVFLAY